MISRRHSLSIVATALSMPAIGTLTKASAQAVTKPARMLVGFTPGGSTDVVARLIASQLKDYAPSVVVENKAGAGGRIALEALKNGEPDGSVMVMTPGDQLALFPHVFKGLPYDPAKDFIPVTTVCSLQFVLAVGPSVPAEVRTLADFINWAQANPKLAAYGSPGVGTRPHFLGDIFARAARVDFTHVPYKGPSTQDLLAGQLASGMTVVSNVLPHVQSGKLRALATTAPQRSAMLPDVPTFREAGYPSLEAVEHFGLLLPARTPSAVVEALLASAQRAVTSDEVKSGLTSQVFEVAVKPRDAYASLIKADFEMWRQAVQASGFKPID